jgi:Uma2 family endonuclease
MPTLLEPWRFTVDDYHRMAKAGILREDDRAELIDGEVVRMAPIGDKHAFCVIALTDEFTDRSSGRYVVSVQNPVRLSRHSELYPDLLLLRPPRARYATGSPGPDDVLLVIEVSDTTVSTDRRVKLPKYATAGIPEAWLVNLPRRTVEVRRNPHDGRYQQVTLYRSGERIAPLALPDVAVAVDDILP